MMMMMMMMKMIMIMLILLVEMIFYMKIIFRVPGAQIFSADFEDDDCDAYY